MSTSIINKLQVMLWVFIFSIGVGNSLAFSSVVLFEDNFDSSTVSSDWKSRFPSNLWIQNGWLHLKNNDGWWPRDAMALVHDGDTNWTDYQYSITVDTLVGAWEHFNILFRSDGFSRYSDGSSGSGYQLDFADFSSTVQLSRRVDGVNTILWQQSWSPVSGEMDITIDISGSRIQAYLDDQLLFDIIDSSPLLYGGIGVHTIWEAESRFDNVLVETVPVPSTLWLLVFGFLGLILRKRLFHLSN